MINPDTKLNHNIMRLILLIFIVISLWYFWQTLTASVIINDAGLFAEMTRVLIHPELDLYVDLWDNKPPSLFIFTAPFVLILGETTQAIQIAAIAEAILFAASTAYLAQSIWSNHAISILAGAMALFYAALIVVTRSIETTLLMSTLGNISLALILRQNNDWRWLTLSGFIFAWAVFAKQPIAIQFLAMLAALWYAYGKKHFIIKTIYVCIGGAVGIILFLLWGIAESDLLLMWQYLVAGNVQYSTLGVDDASVFNMTYVLRETLPILLPLTVPALVALAILIQQKQIKLMLVMLTCLITGLLGAGLGASLKVTYFLQVMPFMLLLTAFAIVYYYQRSPQYSSIIALILSIVMIASTMPYYSAFRHFIDDMHALNPPTLDAATYIQAHSDADDCILLWGYANNLSYYSQRLSCTAVPYEAMVMNAAAFDVERYRVQYMNDLIANPPRFLLYGNAWTPFATLQQYINRYLGDAVTGGLPFYEMDTSAFKPLDMNFSDYFWMVGTDIHRSTSVCAGDTLSYAPVWRSQQATSLQYQLYIHIRATGDDRGITQFDGAAVPERPTQTWTNPDEILLSPRIELTLPPDLPAGTYYAALGFYDITAFSSLPIMTPTGNVTETRIDEFVVAECD